MKTTTNLKMLLPEGKDPVNIGDLTGNFETLDTYLADVQKATSDASKMPVIFSQAADRQNIASTEMLSTIMGKIARFFSDIKAAAFCAIANNDNTTAEGYVADARIVKTHGDEIDALKTSTNNSVSSLEKAISENKSSISSLNSNLANVSGTVSGHTDSINGLNSANSARYTENGRINVYVGSDSKLHFVNRDGADTALNFSGGKYTVTQFTISSNGGTSNFATFDFGAYFSSYSEFLKHSIVAVAGSDTSSGSNGSGFCIYNGSEHIFSNTGVDYPSTTSIRVRNYQGLPVGNTVNFICIFT